MSYSPALRRLPHVVYRCFAADGELLYIGCARHAGERVRDHRYNPRSQEWLPRVAQVTTESFPDYQAALAAEAWAIYDECPTFNVLHNHRREAS